MKIISLIIVGMLFVLSGCCSTRITKQTTTGDKWEVRSVRFLWQTERVSVELQTNGVPKLVEINKTQADTEAIVGSASALGTFGGTLIKTAATK